MAWEVEDAPKGWSWSRAGTAGVLHWLFPKTRSAGCSAAGMNVVLVPGYFVLLGPSLCSHCCYSFFFCGSSPRFSCFLPSCRQHRTVITGLTFSPDGNFMFSSCLQGTLALYSSVVPKSHVLRVLGKTLGLWVAVFFPPVFVVAQTSQHQSQARCSLLRERGSLENLLSCSVCVYALSVSKP